MVAPRERIEDFTERLVGTLTKHLSPRLAEQIMSRTTISIQPYSREERTLEIYLDSMYNILGRVLTDNQSPTGLIAKIKLRYEEDMENEENTESKGQNNDPVPTPTVRKSSIDDIGDIIKRLETRRERY